MAHAIMLYYGSYRFLKLHPLQFGILRRKVRATRRPSFPKENFLLFYPRQVWETVSTWLSVGLYFLKLRRIANRIFNDAQAKQYMDVALSPVGEITEPEPHEVADACETAEPAPAIVPLGGLSKKATSDHAPGTERAA